MRETGASKPFPRYTWDIGAQTVRTLFLGTGEVEGERIS